MTSLPTPNELAQLTHATLQRQQLEAQKKKKQEEKATIDHALSNISENMLRMAKLGKTTFDFTLYRGSHFSCGVLAVNSPNDLRGPIRVVWDKLVKQKLHPTLHRWRNASNKVMLSIRVMWHKHPI